MAAGSLSSLLMMHAPVRVVYALCYDRFRSRREHRCDYGELLRCVNFRFRFRRRRRGGVRRTQARVRVVPVRPERNRVDSSLRRQPLLSTVPYPAFLQGRTYVGVDVSPPSPGGSRKRRLFNGLAWVCLRTVGQSVCRPVAQRVGCLCTPPRLGLFQRDRQKVQWRLDTQKLGNTLCHDKCGGGEMFLTERRLLTR